VWGTVVSVGIAASPNESDDTKALMIGIEKSPAIYFPSVVVDDEMMDDDALHDLTGTAWTCRQLRSQRRSWFVVLCPMSYPKSSFVVPPIVVHSTLHPFVIHQPRTRAER
jgi:hypothetical protein